MNKKGSHVGFAVSFMLFMIFIIFMYILLASRTDFGDDKKNSLEYLKSQIIERVSGDVIVTSLNVNLPAPAGSCFRFDNFIGKIPIGNRVKIQNDSGDIFTASVNSQDIYINREISESTFFKVYSSEEFSSASGNMDPCAELSEAAYTIGLSREENYIFESKILELLDNYKADYGALKKDIKISQNDEFGLVFTYKDGTEVRTPEKDVNVNVYSERVPILYMKTNSKIESGFIDISIW